VTILISNYHQHQQQHIYSLITVNPQSLHELGSLRTVC